MFLVKRVKFVIDLRSDILSKPQAYDYRLWYKLIAI